MTVLVLVLVIPQWSHPPFWEASAKFSIAKVPTAKLTRHCGVAVVPHSHSFVVDIFFALTV